MKFSHVIAYLMLPVITLCNSNTYSSNNSNTGLISGPTRTENAAIKNILENGVKVLNYGEISGEKTDGTFTAYFKPKANINGTIEVNLWDTWKKGDGGKINVGVENGKFSLYDKDNNKYRISEFEDDNKQYRYGIIEYKINTTYKQQYNKGYKRKHSSKTKYYLAAYTQDGTLADWYVLDNDKDLHSVGETSSNLL